MSKVVIKQPHTVLVSCYTYREWIERRKRKHVVRRELQRLKPQLAVFDAQGNLNSSNRKRFKVEYHVSPAIMQQLLDQPGEHYFAEAK